MDPSAALCRAEQARHLALALNDPLPNRRVIAARAAAAWHLEALRAEEREAGGSRVLSPSDAKIASQFAAEAADEREDHAD